MVFLEWPAPTLIHVVNNLATSETTTKLRFYRAGAEGRSRRVFRTVKFFATQSPVEKAASSVDGFPSREYPEWHPRMRMTYFFAVCKFWQL